MTASKVKLGKYQHYKGQYYQVTGIARHSESEEWMVIYELLYGDSSTWVRPLSMFIETITVEGKTQARFSYIESNQKLTK